MTALTGQGTCGVVGVGATTVSAGVGTLTAGTTVTANFIVQIVSNAVTGTTTFSATDIALNPVTGSSGLYHRHSDCAAARWSWTQVVFQSRFLCQAADEQVTTTTHTFSASNTTSTVVDNVTFTISEPLGSPLGR